MRVSLFSQKKDPVTLRGRGEDPYLEKSLLNVKHARTGPNFPIIEPFLKIFVRIMLYRSKSMNTTYMLS